MGGRLLAEEPREKTQESKDYYNGNSPPNRTDASGEPSFRSEFSLDVVFVIERFIGQVQAFDLCFLGPSGRFTRTAFWTGFRVARDVRAAVWACVGRHW